MKHSKPISDLVIGYKAEADAIRIKLASIEESPPFQLDLDSFSSKLRLLESQLELNIEKLVEKEKEPSRSITLKDSSELLGRIKEVIETANKKIAQHNRTVDNSSAETATLKAEVWRFLLDGPLKDDLAGYLAKKSVLDKAVDCIHRRIAEKEASCRNIEREIAGLEKVITSIQPTIHEINALLRSFGFDGFSLAQVGDSPCYRLVRSDGSEAKETLSEGEKTFVTFLYFFHLLKGSPDHSGTTNDRIVVIDDPVSSLDSDVLFVVSTLVRKLCDEVKDGNGTLKQLFLLTHNVYFHKEVTYSNCRGKNSLKEESFWTVDKSNGISRVRFHQGNPIKSSYELLWVDVRERRTDNLSLQNTLRRILESYFKILGGIDLKSIHEQFEGKEKLACKSLLSWVNDGSHSAHDDLYVSIDDSTAELYLEVFRQIFRLKGHFAHYSMMMRGVDVSEE